ncbi:hypothetical protein P154DRAFT_569715 [Amniculicola lignicola CBS 123094]|uniref:Ankyrin n=1 Tax=Amniculicola lignicola CBS 123094 TaxID=1392246 RepID=A0A6A5X2E2_9PLEO|nr:hypothetical protein P154DRAFT_569715 [Amniculicola lignicola CBS 123094]
MLMDGLNLREVLIACSSVEATSATFCMALSDKEVLAFRWLVSLGFLAQMGASITEVIALRQIVILILALVPVALSLMRRLNKVEQAQRDRSQYREGWRWTALPATISTSYLVFWFLALLHGTTSFLLLGAGGQESLWQQLYQWGQSAPILVTVVTVFHICYCFLKLFSRNALDTRIKIARGNGSDTGWTSPLMPWRTWYIWKTIRQRHPFRKVKLLSSDDLLVQVASLLPIRQQTSLLRTAETEQKWKELLASFALNDEIEIRTSLDEDAPIGCHNKYGDYPIYLAVELGSLDITPLEAALDTNKTEVFDWMLASLPQTQNRYSDDTWLQIKETIVRAMLQAIGEGKTSPLYDLLKWPGLREKRLSIRLLAHAVEKDNSDCIRIILETQPADTEDSRKEYCSLILKVINHRSEGVFNSFIHHSVLDSILHKSYPPADHWLDRVLQGRIDHNRLLPLLERRAGTIQMLANQFDEQHNKKIARAMADTNTPLQVLDFALNSFNLDRDIAEALEAKGAKTWHSVNVRDCNNRLIRQKLGNNDKGGLSKEPE